MSLWYISRCHFSGSVIQLFLFSSTQVLLAGGKSSRIRNVTWTHTGYIKPEVAHFPAQFQLDECLCTIPVP